jgi:hypothetical protein
MDAPFHHHFFNFTPLLEQELSYDLVGVIRECNFVGTIPNSNNLSTVSKEHPDRVVIFTSVVGQLNRNLAAPGANILVHINGRCKSPKILGIWISTFF